MKAHLFLNFFLCHLIGLAVGFTNPIKTGSDPQIVYHDGMYVSFWSKHLAVRLLMSVRYYLTSTTWTDVRITAASTIDGLKTAESVVIWSDVSNPDRACNLWAPEIHKVGDRWHVYFTASKCDPDWGVVLPTLRVYVLEGGMEHPLSSDYRLLDSIVPPNYDGGMLDAVGSGRSTLKTAILTEDSRHFSILQTQDICLYVFVLTCNSSVY